MSENWDNGLSRDILVILTQFICDPVVKKTGYALDH